jgi:P-type Cu+ transporter
MRRRPRTIYLGPYFTMETTTDKKMSCFHCGEAYTTERIRAGDKLFCCEGCKMVFRLLDGKGLCDYYQLNERPGINQRIAVRKDKFSFLDDETGPGGDIFPR